MNVSAEEEPWAQGPTMSRRWSVHGRSLPPSGQTAQRTLGKQVVCSGRKVVGSNPGSAGFTCSPSARVGQRYVPKTYTKQFFLNKNYFIFLK